MADKPDDRVLKVIEEIRAAQHTQGKALQRMEKQMKDLTARVERLEEYVEDKF